MLCMENETVSTYQLKHDIYNLATLLNSVFNTIEPTATDRRWVTWHPEEGMAMVLNVDGSSLGNPGASGFRGVLRRTDGS